MPVRSSEKSTGSAPSRRTACAGLVVEIRRQRMDAHTRGNQRVDQRPPEIGQRIGDAGNERDRPDLPPVPRRPGSSLSGTQCSLGPRARPSSAARAAPPTRPGTSARPTNDDASAACRRDAPPKARGSAPDRKSLRSRSRRSSSRSSAQSRNGPRSQASIGTPKPILGRSIRCFGHVAVEDLAQDVLALAVPDLGRHRQPPGKFDDPVVEERHPAFEADRHARAVDLGEDVVGQIGERVEIHHRLAEIARRPARRR